MSGTAITSTVVQAGEAVRLGMLYGVIAEAIVIALLWPFGVLVWKVCLGEDNRVSTSKTIPAIWTLVFGAMLLALVYAYAVGHHRPLNATNAAGIVGQYAFLFGGPLGAAILAKGIVSKQARENPGLKPAATKPQVSDLVTNDKGEPELGDLQYVLFNTVALVFVLVAILTDPIKGIPHLPEVLLGLTSVSAVGFVGKKALQPTGLEQATLQPSTGPVGTKVAVNVTGLQPAAQQPGRFWVRFGEADRGEIREAPVTSGNAAVVVLAPLLGSPASQTVEVSVLTAAGDTFDAGKFTYT
jgi:hypothetical protein